MSCRFSSLLIYLLFYTNLFSQNAYPIILIHGFLGWGRDEMAGYYYWGVQMDLQSDLQNKGYDVYSVSIGPISPN